MFYCGLIYAVSNNTMFYNMITSRSAGLNWELVD